MQIDYVVVCFTENLCRQVKVDYIVKLVMWPLFVNSELTHNLEAFLVMKHLISYLLVSQCSNNIL